MTYAALSALMFAISFFRARRSDRDFADATENDKVKWKNAKRTKGQDGARIFGRPFVTAGWSVLAMAAAVAGMEIACIVLILDI